MTPGIPNMSPNFKCKKITIKNSVFGKLLVSLAITDETP